MTTGRWLDEHEERAWRALHFMHMRLTAELAHRLTSSSGLSYPDYMVLVALTDQPDGRMRPFELGRTLGWEKSRLSHHIRRMIARGLVDRETCSDDRRGAFVAVSTKGRTEIEGAAPGHVDAVRQLFIDPLTPQQLDALRDAAETVLAALEGEPDQDGSLKG